MKNNESLLAMLLNQQPKAKLVLVQEFTENSKLDDLVCVIEATTENEFTILNVDISFNGEQLFFGTLEKLKEQLTYLPPLYVLLIIYFYYG